MCPLLPSGPRGSSETRREVIKIYTNMMKNISLNPWWIVGLTDGDGHFRKHVDAQGYTKCSFVISQDKRSVHVLDYVREYFLCGFVHKAGKNMMEYAVSNKADLENIIIPFFDKYPLQTLKINRYLDMRSFFYPETSFHVEENAKQLSSLDSRLTRGDTNINIDWLSGFIDAEGCFYFGLCLNKKSQAMGITKYIFLPKFFLGSQEEKILQEIQSFLGFGCIRKIKNKTFFMYELSSLSDLLDLTNILCPRLQTIKWKSLMHFIRILRIMEKKQHLTEHGMFQIKLFKTKMNKF